MNFISYKKNTKATRLPFSVGAFGGTQVITQRSNPRTKYFILSPAPLL